MNRMVFCPSRARAALAALALVALPAGAARAHIELVNLQEGQVNTPECVDNGTSNCVLTLYFKIVNTGRDENGNPDTSIYTVTSKYEVNLTSQNTGDVTNDIVDYGSFLGSLDDTCVGVIKVGAPCTFKATFDIIDNNPSDDKQSDPQQIQLADAVWAESIGLNYKKDGVRQSTLFADVKIGVADDLAGAPEPAAWLMMAAGCAVVGAGLRRRRMAIG